MNIRKESVCRGSLEALPCPGFLEGRGCGIGEGLRGGVGQEGTSEIPMVEEGL